VPDGVFVPRSGGTPTNLGRFQTGRGDVAADDTSLYITDYDKGVIRKIGK
jgi:hypothetical protein